MPNMALTIAALLGGAVVIDYGVKNAKSAFTTAPASSSNNTSAGSSAVTNVTQPKGSGGAVYGDVTYAEVQAIGKAHGWTQAQINDWFHNLIPSESNGTLTDTNSKTGAYGVGQFLAPGSTPTNVAPNIAKYAQYGGNASTIWGQLIGMANYIEQNFGNPSAAWAYHLQHNSY